jgi:Putative sensor
VSTTIPHFTIQSKGDHIMNTITWQETAPSDIGSGTNRTSPVRRFFSVVAQPQSYRNLGYLLLGLPLGTIWFSVLISAVSVGLSMLVVALLGIPLLLGTWYVIRAFANVERGTATALLGIRLAPAPMEAPHRGNLWVRLRSMSGDRDRWRELAYLVLRLPVGIATFTIAVTAVATPFLVASAPFTARYGNDHPFGEWSQSSRVEDIATSSPWSWFLVPLGLAMLFVSFHLMNLLARACGRWTEAWLGEKSSLFRGGRG